MAHLRMLASMPVSAANFNMTAGWGTPISIILKYLAKRGSCRTVGPVGACSAAASGSGSVAAAAATAGACAAGAVGAVGACAAAGVGAGAALVVDAMAAEAGVCVVLT